MGWSWSDLGSMIADFAPALGTLIGGPAGPAVGSIIASVFGAENHPEALSKAIKTDPEAAEKLRKIELAHQTEIARLILADQLDARAHEPANLTDMNAAMRDELVAKGAYHSGWRPFLGYIIGLSLGGIFAGLVYALFTHPENASLIVQNATAVLVMALGVLGYNARQRSRDKEVAAGFKPVGIIEQFVKKGS